MHNTTAVITPQHMVTGGVGPGVSESSSDGLQHL